MNYIWINPVARAMYGYENIKNILEAKGFMCVEAQHDWSGIVREKYGDAVRTKTGGTVVDGRCPKAYQMVKQQFCDKNLRFEDIQPILIHTAIDLSQDERYQKKKKWITTPCQCLADEGNGLHLENTEFMTWREFMRIHHIPLQAVQLQASPIPPGFFAGLPARVNSMTKENVITDYFAAGAYEKDDLVELLYCQNGCHNGDGI